MNKLEKRFQDSVRRIIDEESKNVRMPENPFETNYPGWLLVALPITAVLGILLGYSLKMNVSNISDDSIAKADTIYVPKIERDTIFNTLECRDTVYIVKYKLATKSLRVKDDVANLQSAEPIAQNGTKSDSEATKISKVPEKCTSVACDGINYYSMLAIN